MIPQGSSGPREGPGYEASDIGIRGILIFGLVLTLVTILTMALLGGWYAAMASRERRSLREQPPRFADDAGQFPPPVIQPKPALDMERHRAAEQERLTSYGWVDREAKIARIPISRALDLALESIAAEQPSTPRPAAPDTSTAPAAVDPAQTGGGGPGEPTPLPEDPFQGAADATPPG
jgi:hypothetical protein